MKKITDYPFVYSYNILWGEMDAFGIVNNTVYFKYFESARLEFYNTMSLNVLAHDKEGMGPILASTSCKYIMPLSYPDKISVGVKVTEISDKRLIFEHSVFSEKGYCSAIGFSELAFMDYSNKSVVNVPEEMVAAINNLQKNNL